jgi:hypothetical protein
MFFSRCAVLGQRTQETIIDHLRPKGAVNVSYVAGCKDLKKGMKVQSPSGKVFTVKEFDDVWCWTTDSNLPWLRSSLV